MLSTCNRFEAYLEVEDSAPIEGVRQAALEILSHSTGLPSAVLDDSVAVLHGGDVVPHLFGVSAGLKSVVIGEDEIAGQVRRSLENAREAGTASANLERLFQSASRASKKVKSQTAIGRADRSLVRLGLELASSRIADWAETAVLLIGTGQYAATTVAALRDRGARNITVHSPSGRAARFAARLSLTVADDLASAVAEADIVITCTSRDQPVVTATVVQPGKRRLVIDLGLPRNVSPEVGSVAGIELLDLETIRLHAPIEELNATSDARALVDSAVETFTSAEAERSASQAVVALRKHVLGLLEDELERARARGTWTPETEAALRHFAGVLLHTPSARARELGRSGQHDAFALGVSALFGLHPPDAVADAAEAADDELLA